MTLTLEEIKEKFSASKSEHVKRSPVYDIQKIPTNNNIAQLKIINALFKFTTDN